MLKRTIALLVSLTLFLPLIPALAEPYVTPIRHDNQSFRDEMWMIILRRVAPRVRAEPQEKWSASRCRQVVDLFEDAGFTITDETKDEMYRKPRAHRWYASEAWTYLLESLFGREWLWSVTDMAYFGETKTSAGLMTDRYLLPDSAAPALDDMVSLFRQEIARQPASADDPPQGYHIVARLMDWNGAVQWMLFAIPDLEAEFPRDVFVLTCNVQTGSISFEDRRHR